MGRRQRAQALTQGKDLGEVERAGLVQAAEDKEQGDLRAASSA